MRCLLLFLITSISFAQELRYQRLPTSGITPSAREDGAITYDAQARRIYLFGGRANGTLNDLWSYSVDQREWTRLQPSGTAPGSRFGHTVQFDKRRQRVVVFGGQASGFFNDTWAYDTQRNSWSQLAGSNGAPNERYGHSAVYDEARDRIIVSHGFTDSGRFDDTWEFNLATNRWREISPASGRPLRRCLHHAELDPAGNQMYLYGGCSSGAGPCPQGDLWSFDLNTNRWTEITGGNKPPARQWYGIGLDLARRKLVIYGGSGGSGFLNDTWEFDLDSRTWAAANIGGEQPAPRQRHEAVSTSDLGGTVFFGGLTNAGLSNDLLLLGLARSSGPRLSASGIANAFSGRTGPLAPGSLVSLFGSGLGPETGVSLGPDGDGLPRSAQGVTVTFNGIAAPLLYLQNGQINAQVPYELAGLSEARIEIRAAGGAADAVTVPISPTSPGLHPSMFKLDGSVVSASNPAAAGEIVILFATGAGVTVPAVATGAFTPPSLPVPAATASLQLSGRSAEILFIGLAPGTAGVVQINARVPDGVSGVPAAALDLR